jgi:hypothetical protein
MQSVSRLPWTYLIRRLFTVTYVPAPFPHLWPSHIGFVALLRPPQSSLTASKQHSQPLSHSSSGSGDTSKPTSLGAFAGYSVVIGYRDTLLPSPSQRIYSLPCTWPTTNQSSKHPLHQPDADAIMWKWLPLSERPASRLSG